MKTDKMQVMDDDTKVQMTDDDADKVQVIDDDTDLRDDLLWGAGAISRYIGRTERQTYYQLEKRQVPARKIGEIWVGSKTTLRAHLAGEQP